MWNRRTETYWRWCAPEQALGRKEENPATNLFFKWSIFVYSIEVASEKQTSCHYPDVYQQLFEMQSVADASSPAGGRSYYNVAKHSAAIPVPYACIPLRLYRATEDTLEDYLIPDTPVLMDVLYRFILLSLMWILLLSWLPAVTTAASDICGMSSVSSHLFWEWLFLIPQIKIRNNSLEELWKCTYLTLIYFSEFFMAGKIRFIKCYRVTSVLVLGR